MLTRKTEVIFFHADLDSCVVLTLLFNAEYWCSQFCTIVFTPLIRMMEKNLDTTGCQDFDFLEFFNQLRILTELTCILNRFNWSMKLAKPPGEMTAKMAGSHYSFTVLTSPELNSPILSQIVWSCRQRCWILADWTKHAWGGWQIDSLRDGFIMESEKPEFCIRPSAPNSALKGEVARIHAAESENLNSCWQANIFEKNLRLSSPN